MFQVTLDNLFFYFIDLVLNLISISFYNIIQYSPYITIIDVSYLWVARKHNFMGFDYYFLIFWTILYVL